MKIIYSPEFLRRYDKLPGQVKEKAEQREEIFLNDPFDKRLKTHKLKGELDGFWAFSVDFKYIIIFRFEEKHTVRFYSIGGHSIYF